MAKDSSYRIGDDKELEKKPSGWCSVPKAFVAVLILCLLAGLIATVVLLVRCVNDDDDGAPRVSESKGEDKVTTYPFAAVASNTNLCSDVGRDIMAIKGGSAVDAAITTLLCIGLVRFHSSGLGGDSFWTIYDRKNAKVITILARSRAPLAGNSTMFVNNTEALTEGGLSVAVPGEVMAFWEAHQRYGRLPWSDLFQPVIKMAKEGFPCEPITAGVIADKISSGIYDRYPTLRALVTNKVTKTWYKAGEIMYNPALARTLERIAKGGANVFYNGTLAQEMVREIQDAGGIITEEDFENYYAQVTEPLQIQIYGNLTAYAPRLPSGGAINLYILNILSGYKMTPVDLSTHERHILTYHRILEAFKHAYATRSRLGSTDGETREFAESMKELLANITNPEQGEAIRAQISDSKTFPWKNYNPAYSIDEDQGTSHMSVYGPNGDAVSVTSTVNFYFGSKVVGNVTGVVFNNLMDDFSTPGVVNGFGVQPSPSNYIKPGKRPLSSMSPTIVIDGRGEVALVVGAAGGTKITTTTALLTALSLWLGEDIKSAIAAPRIHHQLLPNEAVISENAPQWLIDGLKEKGHEVTFRSSLSTPCGIQQLENGRLLADAQGSVVSGF